MVSGRSRGPRAEAMTAIKEMSEKMLDRKPLFEALSKSREVCKRYLAQTEQRMGSSRPPEPRQSPNKDTKRVQP